MIDTILFIEKGKIARVLQLSLTVKVPEGMDSGDLARPVIMITDFEDQKVYYEIYSFGQQIVVIPLDGVDKNATTGNTKKAIHSFAEE